MHERQGDRGAAASSSPNPPTDSAHILYSHDNESNVCFKNYFGMLDSRRAAAREAIAMVLQRADSRGRKRVLYGLTSDFADLGKPAAGD